MIIKIIIRTMIIISIIISMNRCNRSCNTVEDPFARICVPNKIEGMNLKVFNLIKGINESRTLIKYIASTCRCNSHGRKFSLRQKYHNDKCQC